METATELTAARPENRPMQS